MRRMMFHLRNERMLMLKYRLLTALITLPLLAFAILKLQSNYFSIALMLITALGAWEWAALVGFEQKLLKVLFVIVILLGIFISFHVNANILLWGGLAYWLWIFIAVICFAAGAKPLGLQLPSLRIVSGILFLVTGFLAIDVIRQFLGGAWLLLMIAIIMAADTGAYFAGRAFGRATLAKRVSPKKTIEGLLGGLLLVLIVSLFGSHFFHVTLHQRILFCCLSVVAGIVSVIGDLSISVMKRQIDLKDTGSFLPGHGGILDRLDSIFSGMLIFALGFLLL